MLEYWKNGLWDTGVSGKRHHHLNHKNGLPSAHAFMAAGSAAPEYLAAVDVIVLFLIHS